MRILIVGASKGLGRALAEGLGQDAEMIIGVSRKAPTDLTVAPSCALRWIEADLSDPEAAAARIAEQAPAELDAILQRRRGKTRLSPTITTSWPIRRNRSRGCWTSTSPARSCCCNG